MTQAETEAQVEADKEVLKKAIAVIGSKVKNPTSRKKYLIIARNVPYFRSRLTNQQSKIKKPKKLLPILAEISRGLLASDAPIRNKAFYESDQWRVARYEALKLSDGRCALCGRSRREHGVILHVDHIKPRSKYPELELDISNLQVLCEDCNMGKGNRDEIDWRKDAPTSEIPPRQVILRIGP